VCPGARQGVVKYGIGRWREILTAPESAGRFDAVRTGVDLKARWGPGAPAGLPLRGGSPTPGTRPPAPGLAGLAGGRRALARLRSARGAGRRSAGRPGAQDKWRSLVSAVMGNKDTRRVALKEEWKQQIRAVVEAAPSRRAGPAAPPPAPPPAPPGGPAADAAQLHQARRARRRPVPL